MKPKLKMFYDEFSKDKEMFHFSNCSANSKYHDDSKT